MELKVTGKDFEFFLWRACSNVLPTAAASRVKKVEISEICTWCHVGVENAVHTLFGCSIAEEVWKSIGLQDMVRINLNDTVMTIVKQIFVAGTKEQSVMVGLICYPAHLSLGSTIRRCI